MSPIHVCRALAAKVAFVLGLAAVAAGPAFAVAQVSTPISIAASAIGTSFTINYNGFVNESLVSGLSAQTIFELASVSADHKTWTFSIDKISNTSTSPVTASRISGFGFDVDAALKSAQTSSSVFTKVGLNGNVPMVGPNLDVCFRAGGGGSNCAGGGGGGVTIGNSISGGSFVLKLVSAADKLVLDNFFVRYQSIGISKSGGERESESGLSGIGLAVADDGSVLPEPGIWLEMIIGFGLCGIMVRRRQGTGTGYRALQLLSPAP